MINLMPPKNKQSMLYARRNNILLNWLLLTSLAVIGAIAIIFTGRLYIAYTTDSYQKTVNENKLQLKNQKLEETKAQLQDISNSFKLVVDVLNKEVLFSKLLQDIGGAMPPGASLQNLSISQINGGIDLQAAAKNYQTGTQIQVNLQDPHNKVFDKADLISITCGNDPSVDYPCQVSIRASFSKNSPYLFANSSAEVKQ